MVELKLAISEVDQIGIAQMEQRIQDMPWPCDLLLKQFDGVAVFDREGRLVLFTERYHDLWRELGDFVRPGVLYRDLVNEGIGRGLLVSPDDHAFGVNHTSVATIGDDIHQFRDGQIIRERHFALDDGGTLSVCYDISSLMQTGESPWLRVEAATSHTLASAMTNIAQGVGVFNSQQELVIWNARACDLLNVPYYAFRRGMASSDVFQMVLQRGQRKLREPGVQALRWIKGEGGRPPIEVDLLFTEDTVIQAYFRSMPDRGFVVTLTDVTAARAIGRELETSRELLAKEVQLRSRDLAALSARFKDEVAKRQLAVEQLEAARAEAVAANLDKTRFLAAASHDILQPLNAARLYLSALEAEQETMTAATRELTLGLQGALGSVEQMLEALFEISKLDSGGVEPTISDFPLQPMLDTLAQQVGAIAAQKGLMLRSVATSAWVRSDHYLLQRMLMNLLNNAVKYTTTGKVLYGVRRMNSDWRIEIWDTGPGIPGADREAIFKEFQRGSAHVRSAAGAGLGLAVVDRAVTLLGHGLSLDTEVGKGTVFRITVPSAEPSIKSAAPVKLDYSASVSNWGQRLVLLLENDNDVITGMKMLFGRWGCPLLVATSFEELVERLEDEQTVPDLAIVDYHLDTAIDGMTAIELLREDFEGLSACLLTADRSSATAERAAELGIDVFTKPIKPAELRAVLEFSFGQFC